MAATAITAQNPGASYNTSNATFTVAGRSDVSGFGSVSGGTDNIQTVVSQADIDAAKAKINVSARTFKIVNRSAQRPGLLPNRYHLQRWSANHYHQQ